LEDLPLSKWRSKAIEWLPEDKQIIERAESPGMLWLALFSKFEKAVKAENTEITRRILQYARWCAQSRDTTTLNAVGCAFWEELPRHKHVRKELPNLITIEEFRKMKGAIACYNDPKIIEEIEQSFTHPYK
jgi:hypothetical protein